MRAVLYARDFKRIINNTKKFTRKNTDVALMNYIYLEIDAEKNEIKATALDGHRVSVEYADLKEVDVSFSCYIKTTIPKITQKDTYTDVEIELDGKKLFVTVGDSIMGYVQPDGKYYDVDKIVNDIYEKDIQHTIWIDPALLKEALEASKGCARSIRIDIRRPCDPVILRSTSFGTDRENIKLVLPARHS